MENCRGETPLALASKGGIRPLKKLLVEASGGVYLGGLQGGGGRQKALRDSLPLEMCQAEVKSGSLAACASSSRCSRCRRGAVASKCQSSSPWGSVAHVPRHPAAPLHSPVFCPGAADSLKKSMRPTGMRGFWAQAMRNHPLLGRLVRG